MKKYILITGLIILASISIILVLIWNISISDSVDIKNVNYEQYIKVKKISDKILLVSLGYDAVTAISTKDGIVVIDAGISNLLTGKYRKLIKEEFKRDDFAYLINTHSHWDHTGGNQVFNDAEILGHENCIVEMQAYWKEKDKIEARLQKIIDDYENQLNTLDPEFDDSLDIYLQRVRYQNVYRDIMNDRIMTIPAKTFSDTINISMSDLTLHIIYFGCAHSGSDIIIHIPEDKILFSGDLFFPGGRPSIGDIKKLDVERWKLVKQWINDRNNNIEIVIGGHGQFMNKEDLKLFIQNLDERLADFN